MAERRNYRGPRNRPSHLPFKDLRELINMKKQQRELEEHEGRSSGPSNGPPPDPPSLLRDSLRGDEELAQQRDDHRSGYIPRGRGYFRRRGRGPRNFPKTDRNSSLDKSLSGKLFAYNIKVEVSTETGQRICSIDNENSETNPNLTKKDNFQSRGNYRGRRRRGRGNYRGQYYYRGQNRRYDTANKYNTYDNRKYKTEYDKKRSDTPTKERVVPDKGNWDDDNEKYNKIKESVNNQNVHYIEEENWDNDFKSDHLEEKITYVEKECSAEDEEYVTEDEQYATEDREYATGDGEYITEGEEYTGENEEYIAGEEEEYYEEDYTEAYNGENYEITGNNTSEYEHVKIDDKKEDDKVGFQSELVDLNSEKGDKIDKNTSARLTKDNLQECNIDEGNQQESQKESRAITNIKTDDEFVNKQTSAISAKNNNEAKIDNKNQEVELGKEDVNKLNMKSTSKDIVEETEKESSECKDADSLNDCDNISSLNPPSADMNDASK